MTSHKLEYSEYNITKRIFRELSLLFILQAILIILNQISFTVEITLIVMYILLLSTKQKRIIYSINIENEHIELCFFTYVFIKRKEKINIQDFSIVEKQKRLGFGGSSKTIAFYNHDKFIGEINAQSTWPWGEDRLNKIIKKINSTKQ